MTHEVFFCFVFSHTYWYHYRYFKVSYSRTNALIFVIFISICRLKDAFVSVIHKISTRVQVFLFTFINHASVGLLELVDEVQSPNVHSNDVTYCLLEGRRAAVSLTHALLG